MRELKELFKDMGYTSKREIIEEAMGWSSLFILIFMMTVIFG